MLVDPDNLSMRYNFACILASYLHDKEGALKLLARTLAATSGPQQVRAAQTDPDLDPLREDPRFQKMMADAERRLGIEIRTAQISAVSS
jgi:adenylate cyclase